MTLIEPQLILTFEDEDIVVSGQEILSKHIVKGSVRFHYQLLDNLVSSSDQVTLQLTRDCPSIADIIKADKDVHAALKNGDITLFTGFLSTNHNWSVTRERHLRPHFLRHFTVLRQSPMWRMRRILRSQGVALHRPVQKDHLPMQQEVRE